MTTATIPTQRHASVSPSRHVPTAPAPEPQQWSLIFDEDSFTEYVRLEAERIANRDSGGRPMGLRLSTACPVRRIREFYDDRYRLPLDAGYLERGFEMESRFLACVPTIIHPHAWQQPITWDAGTSAWDGGRATYDTIPVSLKSAVGKLKPSTDNTRQDERMLVADGAGPGAAVDTYMLDPSHLTAFGPIRHVLTEERYSETKLELVRVHDAMTHIAEDITAADKRMNDGTWWHDVHSLACTCGGCTKHDNTVDADHPLEQLAMRYDLTKAGETHAAAATMRVREQLIEAATIRLQVDPAASHVKTYMPAFTITRNKRGVWSIRRRNG